MDERVRTLAVALAVALAGLAAGAGVTIAIGAGVRALGFELGIAALLVLTLIATQGIGFGGTALGYLRLRGLGLDFVGLRVPTVRDFVWVGAGYVLALGGAFLAVVVVVLAGAPAARNRVGELAVRNPEILLLLIPFSVLLIGPGEELLFRGIVQGTLREAFGPVGAVGIASAVFAAVHVVALSGEAGARLVTVGVLFLPSLVFGTAYERTGNLVVPALIHGGYNATLFTLVYVSLAFA